MSIRLLARTKREETLMEVPNRCAGPVPISRRRMLQIGGIAPFGLSLTGLLRGRNAEAIRDFRHAEGRRLHPSFSQRRAEPPRHVGHEARRALRDSRRVQVDRHQDARLARFRALAALFEGHSSRDAHSIGASRREQLSRRRRLLRSDRSRSRRTRRWIQADRQPRDRLGRRPLPTPFANRRALRRLAIHDRRSAGGPPQPGFFGGWLGRTFDPLFILKDPNRADFGMPELGLPPGVDSTRFEARKRLVSTLGKTPSDRRTDRKLQDMDGFQAQAFDLVTAPATRARFNSIAKTLAPATVTAATFTARASCSRAACSKPARA